MLHFRMSVFLRFALLIFMAIGLTACFEVKQGININKDGSGEARMEFAIQREVLSMPGGQQQISGMKAALQKEGWNIEGEKDSNGKHFITATKKFKDISELNDNETKYAFSSEKKGFLKKSYAINIKYLKSSDMPFPYEVTIDMPGSIDETDGTKLSSGKVKWSLQGFRKGTILSAKSSAFAMPDFGSLKEAFNKAFNKIFYREAIVFLRDGNLWVMDSNGKNQRQLTKETPESDEGYILNTFGHFDVSSDGKIVYDRRRKYTEEGNIFIISLKDGIVKKITDSNDTYSPSFSPEGDKIAVAKIKKAEGEFFLTNFSQGNGIWIIDLKTGRQRKLLDSLPPKVVSNENIRNWYDNNISWSSNGKYISFQRHFEPAMQAVIYIVSAEDGHILWNAENMYVMDWHSDMVLLWHPPDFYPFLSQFYLLDIKNKKLVQLFKGQLSFTKSYNAGFLPDGKRIIFFHWNKNSKAGSDIYIIDLNNHEKLKIEEGFEPAVNFAGSEITFLKKADDAQTEIWKCDINGSSSRKLVSFSSNASSPKWTALPRVSFISPTIAKIIILAAIALTGLLLLFGMALVTRKAVKAVVSKIPKSNPDSKAKGIFCTQCGTQNPESASFCKKCGQRLKE